MSGLLYWRFLQRLVFSRHRRVAQRLERLLDTQEVGGSSPPVPTTRLLPTTLLFIAVY